MTKELTFSRSFHVTAALRAISCLLGGPIIARQIRKLRVREVSGTTSSAIITVQTQASPANERRVFWKGSLRSLLKHVLLPAHHARVTKTVVALQVFKGSIRVPGQASWREAGSRGSTGCSPATGEPPNLMVRLAPVLECRLADTPREQGWSAGQRTSLSPRGLSLWELPALAVEARIRGFHFPVSKGLIWSPPPKSDRPLALEEDSASLLYSGSSFLTMKTPWAEQAPHTHEPMSQ